MAQVSIVTGAFGFTGSYIARRLLEQGDDVITLTGHPERRDESDDRIRAVPFNFDEPEKLAESMTGASVLYNTYWIRFEHGGMTFDKAVSNTKTLIRAAKEAGVSRIVHVSITNPSSDSPLPYFRGKAIIEQEIVGSGLSYAILRPAVVFGDQGILINNIAWFMRRFPVFAVPGRGDYKLQPIFVEDLAELAISKGTSRDNRIIDAVGPEVFTFDELMRLIKSVVGSRTRLIHANPRLAFLLSKTTDRLVGDVVLTWDEVIGLMDNLLVSDQPPSGNTLLSEWLTQNADWLGIKYMSELKKHYR